MTKDQEDLLFDQVARIGVALGSPKRLQLLSLLSQGEKNVESLTKALASDVRLTSSHLRVLREARLVTCRREGKYSIYRLSGPDVAVALWKLKHIAESHLFELQEALELMAAQPEKLTALERKELIKKARNGEIILIDVRPLDEFFSAHLPHARSMPLAELESRVAELPKRVSIVAYCRGPYCLMSDEAIKFLKSRGFKARKIPDGVVEWQAAGLPVERALNNG
jgi:rhodanese-related sulfurtransferase